MNIRKNYAITIIIILASFAISMYFYPQMPEKLASHWDSQGQVDGYMSKFWGLFLLPFVMIGILLLFIAIPKIDPLKSNIMEFRHYYQRFLILFMGFLFYTHLLTILWNIGLRFDMIQLFLPAISIFVYYSGILIENSKMNWFVGIRTPWTLSNEKVWNKTHKIGGKLFKAAGIIVLLGILIRDYAIFIIIIPIITITIYTIVYSYIEYQKETKF
ncbi:hypothetical protein AC481_03250 [miscellaneous Crenarchaeota group archaeon SMTZ-80]|nr:MAG: hypothetical protein AC481_03250 [miscellaneous Crenarchaeota group archaeon SMTZ-80]